MILPGFLITLFGGNACKLLSLQKPAPAGFSNRELLWYWDLRLLDCMISENCLHLATFSPLRQPPSPTSRQNLHNCKRPFTI